MNEYISKKTIIDALEEENERQPFQPTSIYSCVIPFIRKLPAADVQPVKHGKWEEVEGYGGWGDIYYRCSVCGEEWLLNDGKPKENNMNFCPRCGARMDGDAK